MKRYPLLAGLFSAFIPGSGQIYAGKSVRGAGILIAVIVVGNLNAIWLSTYASSINASLPRDFWAHTLPRLLHDVFAFYGVVFLLWQIVDAYLLVKSNKE
jgi:hypothetical protein